MQPQLQRPLSNQKQVIGQFIRDMSFENIVAQNSIESAGQPDIQVQVNLDARKHPTDKQYVVSTKIKVEAKTKKKAT